MVTQGMRELRGQDFAEIMDSGGFAKRSHAKPRKQILDASCTQRKKLL